MFESELLLLLFLFSGFLLKGFLNVELMAFEFLAVQVLDGGVSSSDSNVLVLLIFKANKGEWGFGLLAWELDLLEGNTLDWSVLSEDFLDLGFSPALWEVLDVDVVKGLSCSVLLLERSDLENLVSLLVGSFSGNLWVVEGNETVAS